MRIYPGRVPIHIDITAQGVIVRVTAGVNEEGLLNCPNSNNTYYVGFNSNLTVS